MSVLQKKPNNNNKTTNNPPLPKKNPNQTNQNPHHKLIYLPLLINSGLTDCQAYKDFVVLFMGQGGWPSLQLDMKAICGY